MTDVQVLFLILGAIYLLQCVVWLPRDCVAFRRGLRGRWKVAPDGLALEALKLRGVAVNPLPPMPGVIACPATTVFVSPAGLAAETLKAESLEAPRLTFVSFEQVHSLRAAEKSLLLNDEPFAELISPSAARHLAELLAKIKKSKAAARPAMITAELQARFNSQAIADRLARHREHTRLLRVSCNLLLVMLFIVAPLVAWQRGLMATWPYLLAALLVYLTVITWDFTRAHRALYPDAGDQRFTDALSVALSPPAALRANDLLMKELLRDFHPVAVAYALFSPAAFTAFASQALRELAFPKATGGEPDAEQARLWWYTSELAALRSFLAKTGTDPEHLLGPPAREADCNSYCPRCWSQYIHRQGACKECVDLALLSFAEEAVPEPISAR